MKSSTSIHQSWLYPIRIAWLLFGTACFILFILNTVNVINKPLPSCLSPNVKCPINTPVTQEDAEIAIAMGFRSIFFIFLPIGYTIARLSLALVGLFIFWKKSDDWVVIMIAGGLISVLLEGAQILDSPFIQIVQLILYGIGTALFLPFPFIFPTGRVEPSWMARPAIIITTFYTILIIFPSAFPQYNNLILISNLLWIGMAAYAMPYRYLRVSGPVERQQTKWVLLGISFAFLTSIYYFSFLALYPITRPSETRIILLFISIPIYAVCYGLFAFSILVAMLRYRLWDIDLVIRRTLQYVVLTALLALTYFGSILFLQAFLTSFTDSTSSPLITVITTLGIAALFTPLRRRVQDFIDHRFYRKKYNAEQVLAQFAATARDEVDMNKLTAALLAVIEETMQPESVSLWLVEEKAERKSLIRTD